MTQTKWGTFTLMYIVAIFWVFALKSAGGGGGEQGGGKGKQEEHLETNPDLSSFFTSHTQICHDVFQSDRGHGKPLQPSGPMSAALRQQRPMEGNRLPLQETSLRKWVCTSKGMGFYMFKTLRV